MPAALRCVFPSCLVCLSCLIAASPTFAARNFLAIEETNGTTRHYESRPGDVSKPPPGAKGARASGGLQAKPLCSDELPILKTSQRDLVRTFIEKTHTVLAKAEKSLAFFYDDIKRNYNPPRITPHPILDVPKISLGLFGMNDERAKTHLAYNRICDEFLKPLNDLRYGLNELLKTVDRVEAKCLGAEELKKFKQMVLALRERLIPPQSALVCESDSHFLAGMKRRHAMLAARATFFLDGQTPRKDAPGEPPHPPVAPLVRWGMVNPEQPPCAEFAALGPKLYAYHWKNAVEALDKEIAFLDMIKQHEASTPIKFTGDYCEVRAKALGMVRVDAQLAGLDLEWAAKGCFGDDSKHIPNPTALIVKELTPYASMRCAGDAAARARLPELDAQYRQSREALKRAPPQ